MENRRGQQANRMRGKGSFVRRESRTYSELRRNNVKKYQSSTMKLNMKGSFQNVEKKCITIKQKVSYKDDK